MMRSAAVFLILAPALLALDPYEPLRLYNGAWTSHDHNPKSGDSITHIVNTCGLVGRFFACQQVVNGAAPTVMLYLPSGPPGHYYTQALSSELQAYGRGELQIDGNRWTYSGQGEENGKTIWHRTINVFSGGDRIHFEVAQSSDNRTWDVTLSGDEVRGAAADRE